MKERNIVYDPVNGLFIMNTEKKLINRTANIRDLIHWNEIDERGEKKYGFKNLTLALTTRCNLQCPYCWQSHGDNCDSDMTKETIDRWLDFFLDDKINNPNKILYYGGEPTLRMDLIEYASKKMKAIVKERNIQQVQQHIFTNGMLLTEKNLDILQEAGAFIVLSLDGNPTVTYRTRGLDKHIYNEVIINAVKSMHRRNMKFGIACTIGDIHFDVENTAQYLINTMSPDSIEFNLRHDAAMVKKFEKETDFAYDSFFKAWDIALDAGVKVIDLAKRARAYVKHTALRNSSSGSKNKLSVMNNGNISTYNGAISFPQLQINPNESNWMKLIRSNWERNITEQHTECQNCEAIYICGQGSAFSSFIQYNDVSQIPAYHCYLCKAELEYFKHRLQKCIKTEKKNYIVTEEDLKEVFLL